MRKEPATKWVSILSPTVFHNDHKMLRSVAILVDQQDLTNFHMNV